MLRYRIAMVLVVLLTAGVVLAQAEFDSRLRAAVSKLDQGDALGALLDFESILRRDPEYWPAYFHLGRAQVQMGDVLGARASFVRAAELDPGNAELHYMVAQAAWQLADFEAAWAQVISAAQAGYDMVQCEQLMEALGQYSEPPPDLEQRLDVPRLLLEVADGEDPDALEPYGLQLRVAIFRSPELGLSQDPTRAHYRVELSTRVAPGRDSDFDVVDVVLYGADGSELGRGEIAAAEDAGGVETEAAAAELVDELETWIEG